MRSAPALTAIAMAVWAFACRDDARRFTGPSAGPETGSVLYLTVSGEAPRPGSVATVTANVAPLPGVKAVGSFAGHLRYDPSGLAFIAESKLPTGIRALNPRPGHIRAAGAAVEGFADGRLFAVTFLVKDPRAMASLEVTLDEMTGTDFANRLPANPLHRTVRLRSLPKEQSR